MVTYNGLAFDTPLLAQWAAFFDLAGWKWSRGLAPVGDWIPDYRATFDCGHSECNGSHSILISVLPVADISTVKGHPALSHFYDVIGSDGLSIADAGAVFGKSPGITYWEMSHGAGGGIDNVTYWADDVELLWVKARSAIRSSCTEK
ncbi:hypothetical protein [Xanthomonas campestris]|uniref:hypothetical protein n=1 Tax=Xanthomonas campestris TaxID=339 RepID=UPI001E38BFF8|nr:hypothetical protein [Xanthomonas campestris]MCC8688346.1 hypothetical protein [Xanthomonas campestris]